jgi:hypothetical protein
MVAPLATRPFVPTVHQFRCDLSRCHHCHPLVVASMPVGLSKTPLEEKIHAKEGKEVSQSILHHAGRRQGVWSSANLI